MTEQENPDLREETAEAAPEVAEHDQSAARIADLEDQLAAAKQETLYAHADIQNVRRRAEKDVADARAYAYYALRLLWPIAPLHHRPYHADDHQRQQ